MRTDVPDTEPRAATSEVPRFAHEVLAVVLQVRDQQLNVLLWRRGAAPFKGCWALPGGPLGADERLGTSLAWHWATKVDLTDIAYLEQLETRSDPRRDPRGRTLATAYLALVATDVDPRTCRTPPGIRSRTCRRPRSTTGPSRSRAATGCVPSCPTPTSASPWPPRPSTVAQLRDIYAASAGHPVSATNLQRVLTRRGVIEATAAAARPTPMGGKACRRLPVRGPDPGRHQPRPVPPAVPVPRQSLHDGH